MQEQRALVRRPSPRLAEGELTHLQRVPLDLERALAQHAHYVETLRALGLEIVEAAPAPEHPDGLFVEDTLVMLERGSAPRALLTRPGAASRRGETASIEAVVEQLGLPLVRVVEPATLDGGDVLVTARHVLVGRTTRSNSAAVEQLAALCPPGRPARGLEVSGALHLKSAVTTLPDGSLIAVPDWIDVQALAALGYTVHRAPERSGGDVLCVGARVLLPADAPASAALIRALGFEVLPLDVSELQKLEAGVTCMSVLL